MTTIRELAALLQHFLTETADEVAQQTGFIERQRKVTGAGFAQALIFSFLAHPAATRAQVQQTAVAAGMGVTTPALDQRFTPKAVLFLDTLLQRALTLVVEGPARPSLLSRFNGVWLADTSVMALPDALAAVWSGVNGPGEAAVKVAVRWDLVRGGLHLWLGAAREHDQQTGVCASPLPAGGLRLADLGFFNLTTFADDLAQGVDFFSRYKVGTHLFTPDGEPIELHQRLPKRNRRPLDVSVLLGAARLPCRLLALPVAPTVAQERRRRLRQQARRKQQPVSERALQLADWTLYVTSLPPDKLAVTEAPILGMTRWQIERLFRLWKESGRLDAWRSQNPWRVWCELYAKLLAVLVQHWLILLGSWQHLDRSLHQAAQVVRDHAKHLLAHLPSRRALVTALTHVADVLTASCRLSKRRAHPLMFQYWLEAAHG